ncbi:MAG: signal peptidase I [Acidimicrobiia bacterium]
MYTRSDDDILPARRRGGRRARPAPPLLSVPRRPVAAVPARPAPPPLLSPPASRRGRRALAVAGDVLLTVAAVLGLATATVTVVAARTGMRPLIVRSGSMEPTIPTGSMVLVQRVPAADVAVGDVVAVQRPDGTRVTHRVVDLDRHGEAAELTLKGDANEDRDPEPVTVQQADRLVGQVPAVGRAAAWLATAPGGFALGCVVTVVAMAALRHRRPGDG